MCLGSAQVRIEGPDGVWVVSGDYKRAPDPTCPPFEPIRCDTFVTESTFGLPIFHWDPATDVIAELLAWWEDNRAADRASLLFCYTLGKAQRILAELALVTDRRVLVHGAMISMIEAYREAGVRMLATSPLIERPRGSSCRWRTDSGAAPGSRHAVDAPVGRFFRRLCLRNDARSRRPAATQRRSWPGPLGSRRLAGAPSDSPRGGRSTRADDARSSGAVCAIPDERGNRERRDPDGVGRRSGRRRATDAAVRAAFCGARSDHVDQRKSRRDVAVFLERACLRQRVGGVLSDRTPAEAPAPLVRDRRVDASRHRTRIVDARGMLVCGWRWRRNRGADPRSAADDARSRCAARDLARGSRPDAETA